MTGSWFSLGPDVMRNVEGAYRERS